MIKALMIAGTHSGAGKTTITLGLMAAFRRRGLRVAPFKVGPDFIDPGHHSRVSGRPSRNLDGWMLSRAWNRENFQRHSTGADIAVVEGVMGLYDGFSGTSEAGSSAQMAKWLDLPVLLVVNAASMARSAAALVQGFERFDPQVRFAGVVFNKLGSKGHMAFLREAMSAYVAMPMLGGMPRNDALGMPERHLGLVTSEDLPLPDDHIALLADTIEENIDLDTLLDGLPEMESTPIGDAPVVTTNRRSVRIGVAMDPAFCFYYQDNLDRLNTAGAELIPFSPLNDADLPEALDGIYLGGGYPELHARRLADNEAVRQAIRRHSDSGMPIYAECGGFMYLCCTLEDRDGRCYPMCNCFPFRTKMNTRLRTLGYREVTLTADTIMGSKGSVMRGHEFHYSDITDEGMPSDVETVYLLTAHKGGSAGQEGYRVNQTLGSYVHLHFGSRPECAQAFIVACRLFQKQRAPTGR